MEARPVLIIGSLLAAAAMLPAAVVGSGDNIPHFQLNWQDEFDTGYADTGYPANNAPNPAVWKRDEFDVTKWYKGQINSEDPNGNDYERQAFLNRPENVRVENGMMVIELRADHAQGVGFTDRNGNLNDLHSSAAVTSRFDAGSAKPSFSRTSRVEFRAKIPHQPSVWPALWLMGTSGGWPGNGEFDVLEYWGAATTEPLGYTTTSNLHWSGAAGHMDSMQFYQMRRPSDAFHIWAMERDAEKIIYFYDDVMVAWHDITSAEQSELRDRDAYVIMNFCYTGTDPAMDRVQMQVDYVREYLFKAGERRHYPPAVAAGVNWESGGNLQAFTNQPLPISASVSGDGMTGRGYACEWEQYSGPGVGVFANPSALQTTVTFPVAGSYRIRLVAHDGQYAGYNWRQVDVVNGAGNTAPSVTAAGRTVMVGHPVKLKATVVDDGLPSGSTSVSWGAYNGVVPTFSATNVLEPTVTFGSVGTSTLWVSASDGALNSGYALVRLTVVAAGANQAPQVAAGGPLNINLGDTITLPGAVSDDGLPEYCTTQSWSQISGPTLAAIAQSTWVDSTATFSAGGTYVLRLTATDGAASTSADLTVNVSMSGNTAPVIGTADPAPLTCNENASGTVALAATDGEGNTLTWSVITPASHGVASVNSGSGLVTYVPTANYVGADSCVVQVSDGQGGADSITINCTVTTTRPGVTALTATPAHVAAVGDAMTLAATVTAGSGHSIDHVAFSIGGTALGNGVFSGGTWNLTYTTTALGGKTITATAYGDDAQTAVRTVDITVVTGGTYGNGGAAWPVPASGIFRLEAEQFDLGGEGVAYHDDNQRQGTDSSRASENVDLETLAPSGINIGYTAAGEWLLYTLNVAVSGTYDLRFRVANGSGAASANAISLLWKGSAIGTPVTVPATGAWAAYTDVVVSGVTLSAGTGILEMSFAAGNANVDWIEFTSTAVASNTAPVANAGADQSITLPATATLSGSATDDGLPAGSSLTYLWSKSSGLGTVTFGSSTSAGTTASFSVTGTYVLLFAASDSAISGTDTVTITVNGTASGGGPVTVASGGSAGGSCGAGGALGLLIASLALLGLRRRRFV